ncbi:MAG: DUF3105 domain-containing protein [Actinomycetes bacterium]
MTTKKQARVRTQDARRRAAEMRRQEQAKERRRRLIIVAVVAVLIAAAGAGIGLVAATHHSKASTIAGVQTFTVASRKHVQGTVHYAQDPPVGGDHNSTWLNCGIYATPVPNENAVHDLEHGAVWITYQPNLSPSDVSKLQSLVKSKSKGYLDLSPYPNLPSPVVASAWGVQLKLNSASDSRLSKFIDKYQLGPTAPERGASCTGGTGNPTG